MRYLSPGVEFYGGGGLIDDNASSSITYFLCSGANCRTGSNTNVGPGFGLTGGSDRVIVKFNLELERFVGAIFAPSPDTGWFF
jgi:hypothetical protein